MPTSRDPASVLRRRIADELSASFIAARPISVGVACEPVDVMGGFSDYTGATVLTAAGERSCAVAIQERNDRQIQVFSFDLFDQHKPFTLVAPVDAITASAEPLRQHFRDPNTAWAACAVGCMRVLRIEAGHSHLFEKEIMSAGHNIAILAGTADPVAQVAAMMRALVRPDALLHRENLLQVAGLARRVLDEIVGQSVELRRIVSALLASPEQLVRIRCQPLDVLEPLPLPAGVRIGAVDVSVDPDHARQLARLRVAGEMGRMLILDKMRQLGRAAGRELIADPINGYLANLDLNDYRRFFRPFLPETIKGGPFLLQHGRLGDKSLHVEPDHHYPVQTCTDFHVFGANRTKNFIDAIQKAHAAGVGPTRDLDLNKAGHLLYAAHKSLNADAGVEIASSDKLVDWVRANESQGFYGAGLGDDRRVAILRAADAIEDFDARHA